MRCKWALAALALCVVLDTSEVMAQSSHSIVGVASYRERMALPAGAIFEATLEDVSHADANADVIGRARLEASTSPIEFTIEYDPTRVSARNRYVVRARISHGEQLWFVSDVMLVALPAQQEPIELSMRRVSEVNAEHGTRPPPELRDSYWRLVRLGDEAVITTGSAREPHLILQSETARVTGFGGCNGVIGRYQTNEDAITFSQMAGTMMACASGMDQERRFHRALSAARKWRIDGRTLELYDDRGLVLARFEAR